MHYSNKVSLALVILLGMGPLMAAPLTTAITYQGNLSDTGALADGDYDFEFELFDSSSGGAQLGASMGNFTGLIPRQALTPAPFALHAEFVPANSITTLEIDTASVQARVSTACVVGQYIRAIDAGGNVSCEVDADTVTVAGSGLSLAGNVMSVEQ